MWILQPLHMVINLAMNQSNPGVYNRSKNATRNKKLLGTSASNPGVYNNMFPLIFLWLALFRAHRSLQVPLQEVTFYSLSLLGWRPSLLGWRPLLLGSLYRSLSLSLSYFSVFFSVLFLVSLLCTHRVLVRSKKMGMSTCRCRKLLQVESMALLLAASICAGLS